MAQDHPQKEFSFQTRARSIDALKNQHFDFLVIGGGITGTAVARDAASRDLKVALVEKHDFAWGTSSRSSKLIHGGLRYLENFEFALVFEALSERTFLLKTVPHMVRPLKFFFPVYEGASAGMLKLSLGLWLYDLLALLHTPRFHKRLNRQRLLKAIPFLKKEKLSGGFSYYDASMWDDVLAIETARDASRIGATVANYVEARQPIWKNGRIVGFRVLDRKKKEEFNVTADRVVVCAGPWTDQVGQSLSNDWQRWLTPSKGVHLVFDMKRIPIPGAMVMDHPNDGRIVFVIPRTDFGQGVVIVGTTDGATPDDPEGAEVSTADVVYLLELLQKYFPDQNLKASDILSAYVGVRPLVGAGESLQKVSREHHIALGPGGTTVVAGGKYTTHRKMAEEIVDFTVHEWNLDFRNGRVDRYPLHIENNRHTHTPVNPGATVKSVQAAKKKATTENIDFHEDLWERYGAEAVDVVKLSEGKSNGSDPDGFPHLDSQLRFAMRTGMTIHLKDFYLRRTPLFACRADGGWEFAERLVKVWAEEMGGANEEAQAHELESLKKVIERRSAWKAEFK